MSHHQATHAQYQSKYILYLHDNPFFTANIHDFTDFGKNYSTNGLKKGKSNYLCPSKYLIDRL